MKEYNHKYIAKLVLRSQKNDSDAFAELYAMTYNKIYNYACFYLKDIHLAQDAVQEVYIRALKNISRIQDPLLFIAWLNQIAFHVCYDMSGQKNSVETPVTTEILSLASDVHIGHNPEANSQAKDENKRLHDAIASLPFHEHQVIIMRYYRDMKLDDIATALEVSRSSVKRYLASGQKKLSELMKE